MISMKRILTLAIAGLLTACTSQISINDVLPQQELDRTIYLRGDFTLWDAEPQYQFAPVGPALYQAEVKFSTPGKVYEFKIADVDFSEGYNCGYSDAQPAGQSLTLGQPAIADCNTIYNYFSFTPAIKGTYIVSIDYSDYDKPQVTITKK
ncbi:hypothetical protein JFJ09_16835 [Pseudoalteromonas arctica]|jgi:hypothetical protein|uniref:Orphan protein n=1 Tax=Pseudoalteromonas arctica TaxID=394751 RepID=A0A7X9U9P6_9GAMM|nr:MULTISPECIES: hypothetical protein [Pseudoalteromonas]MBH0018240.1 hypothetical protein [Pseudoalteromonas sp. NGC95]MBH0081693.1 hypothetical protein [Pseudoalteromonas sp. NZS11]MBZ2193870.1 hypothetical protein [Pseudoalteromonas arctica]NMF50119.1 hypothetical protein [Pseudoalteromonas arctica]PKH93064.1 hypothetical protein CXF76_03160 [Pseudoalteromonas sp. 78C3]